MFTLKLNRYSHHNDALLKNVKFICENLNSNHFFAINELNQILTIKNKEINVVYELEQDVNQDVNQDTIQLMNQDLTQSTRHNASEDATQCTSSNQQANDVKQNNHSNNLIAFGHLPDLELLCLIYSSGSICTLNLESKKLDQIDLGYRIVTADFSPECDKIVLTTDANKLVLLNAFFDQINFNELDDQKQGAVDHLNVGWGKKETQFHGSEGKQARTIKKEILTCSKFDDLKPRVTWRDDGVFFATSVVSTTKHTRKIRIYDNEGVLQQTSEEHSGLEYSLTWKPNGNLITSSVNLTTGQSIVFFEKNGQRFDEFRLPYKNDEFELQKLVWSNVADCLVISGIVHPRIGPVNQVILIYSMRNFHWYFQQKLVFASKERIRKLVNQNQLTNEFEPLKLLILFEDGTISEYVYSNQIYASPNSDCAVIDGKKVQITPFQYSVVPPPMYAYALIFDTNVNELCFSQPLGRYLLVKLADSSLRLIERSHERSNNDELNLEFQSISFKQPNLPAIFSKSLARFQFDLLKNCFYQLVLTDHLVAYALNETKNELISINLSTESTNITKIEQTIKLITYEPNDQFLVLVDKNGLVWKLKNEKLEQFLNKSKQVRLRTPIESIVKLVVSSDQCAIALYSNYILYVNHLPIQGDCNSFLIHSSNLLMYTTNDHRLRSIWLDDIHYALETFDLPDYADENDFRLVNEVSKDVLKDEKNAAGNQVNKDLKAFSTLNFQSTNTGLKPIDRTVERTCRLVNSCSTNCKLITQMSRGNLEIITPRLLVLDRIKFLLNTLQYDQAFQLMKKHRIDLNLIVDNDLECFLLNINEFVQQISNTADMCLFISELNMNNVIESMYSTYNRTLRQADLNAKSKSLFDWKFPELRGSTCSANLGDQDCVDGQVKRMCSLLDYSEPKNAKHSVPTSLRNAMLESDEQKYFIPILLTYLKPPSASIGMALLKIYSESDKEVRTNALNYLKYIIEMHQLVKEALGTYDLNIAKMVYAVSNLDPKEYLPLLAKLESYQDDHYRSYQIDLYLQNYDGALAKLTDCVPFDKYANEAIELIEDKHLYQTAIPLFISKTICRSYLNQVYSLYGDYLLVKKYFNEALIMYKRGKNYWNAIKAAQLVDNWNQVIECVSLAEQQLDESILTETGEINRANLRRVYQSTAEQLENAKDAKNASLIYGLYLKDWCQAIRVLIKGHKWFHVYRLLRTTDSLTDNQSRLTESQLAELTLLADEGLKQHYEESVDFLNEHYDKLRNFTERLQKVRENKLHLFETMNLTGNLNDFEGEFLNDQSTVSTVNSVQSGKRRSMIRSSKHSQTNSLGTNPAMRRKKKEESHYRLREGGRDEDLGLIYHIRLRLKKIEELKPKIKLLITALADRTFDELAALLQKMFNKLLQVVAFVVSMVWQDELLFEHHVQNVNEFSVASNKYELVNLIQDAKLQKPPKSKDLDWNLIILD